MTDISPDIFRAYDVRGVYPDTLNEEAARKTGLAYADLLSDADTFVVGRDYRASGPVLQKEVVQALLEKGKQVIDIGTTATPVFYFAIAKYGYDAGVMVTGSHNPKDENGLKLNTKDAAPIYGEIGIYEMRDKIMAGDYDDFEAEQSGKITDLDPTEEYIEDVVGRIKLERSLKIVLDIGNSACGDIPRRIFEKLGCEVIALYEDPDPEFPNHPADPMNPDNMRDLQAAVKKHKADCGFAYDGDGDRVGLVDEKGNLITVDHVLNMLARQALAANQNKGHLIFDVRSSVALLRDIEEHGGTPHISRVGHSYLLKEILERKAIFGGEVSGHIYFPYTYYPFDDGIFASCKLAEIVAEQDSIAGYIDSLPRLVTNPEFYIESTDADKFKQVERFAELLKEKGYQYSDVDGARVEFEHGWGLVRASNTTPHIKGRFEADTQENLDAIIEEMKPIMLEAGIDLDKAE